MTTAALPSAKTAHLQDLTDAETAALIAGGDVALFQTLMRRHNQTLYRTARSILNDDGEAEDAVQEAYVSAFQAMGRFRGDAKLSTWLVRITVNEAIGRVRKRKRRAEVIDLAGDRHVGFDAGGFDGGGRGESPSDDHTGDTPMGETVSESPERASLRAELRALIEEKIRKLPDAFRTVFVLRALEEMTVDETAECLGIPAETVRTRHFRARSLLREALAREIDFSFEDAFSFAGDRCDRIVAAVLKRLEGIETSL